MPENERVFVFRSTNNVGAGQAQRARCCRFGLQVLFAVEHTHPTVIGKWINAVLRGKAPASMTCSRAPFVQRSSPRWSPPQVPLMVGGH